MRDYKEYLTGKQVALVGPAATLRGSGMGAYIDSFDVVVRINHAWPLPEALIADIGARTDVIYHNLNPINQRIRRRDVIGMHKDGVKWLVSTHPTRLIRHRRRQKLFRRVNRGLLRFRIIPTSLKYRLRRQVGPPNSGLVAICHVLSFPITHLYVTGFSFYTTGYLEYANYRKIPKSLATRHHNQRRHRAYISRLVAREKRIEVDPFIARLLSTTKR